MPQAHALGCGTCRSSSGRMQPQPGVQSKGWCLWGTCSWAHSQVSLCSCASSFPWSPEYHIIQWALEFYENYLPLHREIYSLSISSRKTVKKLYTTYEFEKLTSKDLIDDHHNSHGLKMKIFWN